MGLSERQYFDEKSHQISVGAMDAFGISISTRYSKAHEMAEMLTFAEKAAQAGLHHFISELFYDSQANLCCFELIEGVNPYDDIVYELRDIAAQTIGQYEICGYIGHGPGVPEYF